MRRTSAAFATLQLLSAGALVALEVRGRVVDEIGAPIVRARVELHRILPRYERRRQILEGLVHPEPAVRVRTSVDGDYKVVVPEAGMWHIDVLADGKIPVRRLLQPLLESEALPQTVLKADAGVEVRVADADGLPVARAQVWLRTLLSEVEGYSRGNDDWQERGWFGLTDKGGRVRLSRRVEDAVEVFAYSPGFMPSEAATPDGRMAKVHLERGAPVTVRFVTPAVEPAAQAVILVGDQQWTSAMTDDEGRAQIFFRPDEPLAFGLITREGQHESGSLQAGPEDLAQGPDQHGEMGLPAPVVLEGRVIETQDRRAAADAWVWTASDPGNVIRADDRGRYRLIQGSGQRWRIGAAKPGYQIAWEMARREVETLRVPTLVLVRSAAVEGRVVDPEGEGIPGAQVDALQTEISVSRGRRGPVRTWAGANGHFRLAGLSETQTYELVIEAVGFAPARHVIRLDEEQFVEITLGPGRTLTGRLVGDSGEPLAGGHLALVPIGTEGSQARYDPFSTAPIRETTTDVDGRFQLEHIPDRSLGLIATKEGFAVTRVPDLELMPGDREVDLGELVLNRGSQVEGVVKDRDGKVIAGADVEADRVSLAFGSLWMMDWGEADPESMTTDADGRFLVENLAHDESVAVTVRHPGFITCSSGDLMRGSGKPTEIVLERAASVSGRVEDEHGDPVEGVLVQMQVAAPARGQLSGRFRGRFHRERIESDEEGVFSLAEVPEGRVELSARGAGYIASEQVELIVVAGTEIDGVVLRVRRGVELSGTVSDARGRPVTGATIMVMREMKAHLSGASLGMSHGRSDAEGHYVVEGIDPDAEGLLLRVRHGDYPSHARSLDLEPGANRLDLILEASVSVAGLVLSPGGDPVAGAMAGLQRESRNFSRNPDTTLSTADGSFEIAGVPAGTYQLFAVKEGYARSIASEPVEVAADRDVRGLAVYLSRGGTIKGRILGLESAEVSQVQVFATDGQTQHLSGFVDPSGEYRVAHVGFTEGTVGAIADGRGQSVAESFDLDTEGGETWVDLEFPQGGSILDGVVLIDGEPWRGVRVMVRGGGDSVGSASTDGSGHFKIHGLRDGSHELTLLGSSTSSHTETVEILGNTEIAIDITSVRISGSVLDSATWEGISGALVVAGSDAEPFSVAAAQAATLQSGHFEIVLPANRSVTLTARADGFAQESISLDTGPGGEITGVELALERAGELELYVRLSSGLHPNMVSVGVLDGAGTVVFSDVVFGTTEEEIRLRSIPPGEWILLVAAAGGATVSVPISVPGPPVAVTLPPEARISVDLSALAEELGFGTLRLLSPGGEPFRMVVSGQVLMEWPVMASEALLPSVPAGDWVVELVDGSGRIWHQPVTTVAGQTSHVTIQ